MTVEDLIAELEDCTRGSEVLIEIPDGTIFGVLSISDRTLKGYEKCGWPHLGKVVISVVEGEGDSE